jgi:hypothetical protein
MQRVVVLASAWLLLSNRLSSPPSGTGYLVGTSLITQCKGNTTYCLTFASLS